MNLLVLGQRLETVNFSPAQWVAMGLMAALFLFAAVDLPRYWRRDLRGLSKEELDQWWPFGRILGSAFLRTLHLSILLLGIIVFVVMTDILDDVFAPSFWRTARLAAAFVGLAAIVLLISIALTNRPRAFVAPRFRDDHGAISDISARLRRNDQPRND